jgi:hypothetical protein
MNDGQNRWWIVALVALVFIMALALATAQTGYAEAVVGLVGLALSGASLVVLLLVIAAVWPGFTSRVADNAAGAPGKTLLVGLVNYLFLGAIALVSLNLGVAAVIGIVLLVVLVLGTLLGLPAVAALVGARLYRQHDLETTRGSETLVGGAALYVAVLTPFVGWFLVLPALCLWSFGAAALTLVSRQRPAAVESGFPEGE